MLRPLRWCPQLKRAASLDCIFPLSRCLHRRLGGFGVQVFLMLQLQTSLSGYSSSKHPMIAEASLALTFQFDFPFCSILLFLYQCRCFSVVYCPIKPLHPNLHLKSISGGPGQGPMPQIKSRIHSLFISAIQITVHFLNNYNYTRMVELI